MKEPRSVKDFDETIREFRGLIPTLESAIGMLIVGQKLGWKVMLLAHDKKTIRKYEEILGVDIREVMPGEGPWAAKSVAWKAAQGIGNFWKAVKGEIPGIRSPKLR